MYVVTVTFSVIPSWRDAFMDAMLANARESLAAEAGCRQFDVCVARDDAHEVFLYEVYDTAGDFEAHLKTPHFLAFSQATAAWVTSKQVGVFLRQ